jgi:hypothetical protein
VGSGAAHEAAALEVHAVEQRAEAAGRIAEGGGGGEALAGVELGGREVTVDERGHHVLRRFAVHPRKAVRHLGEATRKRPKGERGQASAPGTRKKTHRNNILRI